MISEHNPSKYKKISGTTLCSQRLTAKSIWVWKSASSQTATRLHALVGNPTTFHAVLLSQQFRLPLFLVKLTKRIKTLQITFTKVCKQEEKYIYIHMI